MFRTCFRLALLSCLAGCGGQYRLASPDQLAEPAGEALTIARLTRQEVYLLDLPVKNALLRFYIASEQQQASQRAAFSDSEGCASAAVPVPDKPGVHSIVITHQDIDGKVVWTQVPLYVWPADSALVAVEIEAIPTCGENAEHARAALNELSTSRKVVYLTTKSLRHHHKLHSRLANENLPAGPIVAWTPEQITPGQAEPLSEIRRMFPNLTAGICASRKSAKALQSAGLEAMTTQTGADWPGVSAVGWQDMPGRLSASPVRHGEGD